MAVWGAVGSGQGLSTLAACVAAATVDAAIIQQAIQANRPNFEDAMQLFAALAAGADLLVTRDPKDFAGSALPVLDPLAALAFL